MWTNGDLRYLALFLEECIDNSRRNIEVNTWLSLASVSNVDVRFLSAPILLAKQLVTVEVCSNLTNRDNLH